MAERKYQAGSKTVQKMTRDGLVEEDLHTGRSKRAVTHEKEGVRIGERPMENYSGAGRTRSADEADRNLRLNRHGVQNPASEQTGHAESPGKHRRYKGSLERKESSFAEAPSLMEESSGYTPDPAGSAEGIRPDGPTANKSSGSNLFAQREGRLAGFEDADTDLHHHSEDYRQDPTEVSDQISEEVHEQRLRQRKRTQYRQGGLRGSNPDNTETYSTYREDGSGRPMEKNTGSNADGTVHVQGFESAGHSGESERKSQIPNFTEETGHGRTRLRETSADMDGLDGLKEEIEKKQKKGRLYHEQRRSGSASRLSFDDGNGMMKGNGAGFSRKIPESVMHAASSAAGTAAGATGNAVHTKISRDADKDENVGTQAAHDTELTAERSVRSIASRKKRSSHRRAAPFRRMGEGNGRLQFDPEEVIKSSSAKTEAEKKTAVKKFFQKQRQRRLYAAAKQEGKAVEAAFRTQQSFVAKAAAVVREAFAHHTNIFLIIGIGGLLFLMISTSITSCGALIQGAGSSFVSTTYPSKDEDIYAVENRYRELEAGLNGQINRMRQAHPDYDEFRYQIDEISHNPYHLISYFTTKYGQFTFDQVKDELEEIFREQYTLNTSGENNVTITETRTIQPGESLGQAVTSGYCSCEICCGPWAGGTTASGVYPASNHTLAVDAYDPFVPMGTHVIMNGIEYVVEDTGAFARFGVQFDVYYDDHQTALAHGHQIWDAFLAPDNPDGALEVTTTRTVDRLSVTLTNHDLDQILQSRLTADEKVRYDLYNLTFGNRNYLFDLNNLPAYGRGSNDYTIPPEALTDERFAGMIAEAEKYLGLPYVWGGYSPSGFDCSGFVCWVVNHCGNGWDIGRTTAEGIRQICYYVSPEEARPGDIIFFEHTYDTPGASHVGIYVGNNMMIHCGEPCQYTSLNGYWQDHFMQFGRLP